MSEQPEQTRDRQPSLCDGKVGRAYNLWRAPYQSTEEEMQIEITKL
jgi:hypothetical protein